MEASRRNLAVGKMTDANKVSYTTYDTKPFS